MSLYARTLLHDRLIVVKRGLILFWRWYFNRSEEDNLNKMKNELVKCRAQAKRLAYLIPKEEAKLKKEREATQAEMSARNKPRGTIWRDSYRPRKEPVRLIEDVKTAQKKPKSTGPPRRKPLLEVHQAR